MLWASRGSQLSIAKTFPEGRKLWHQLCPGQGVLVEGSSQHSECVKAPPLSASLWGTFPHL